MQTVLVVQVPPGRRNLLKRLEDDGLFGFAGGDQAELGETAEKAGSADAEELGGPRFVIAGAAEGALEELALDAG
jgi:hypothetical protein